MTPQKKLISTNYFSHEKKVDGFKKYSKSKWCCFFDLKHFRPWPFGGFLRKFPNRFGYHMNRAK